MLWYNVMMKVLSDGIISRYFGTRDRHSNTTHFWLGFLSLHGSSTGCPAGHCPVCRSLDMTWTSSPSAGLSQPASTGGTPQLRVKIAMESPINTLKAFSGLVRGKAVLRIIVGEVLIVNRQWILSLPSVTRKGRCEGMPCSQNYSGGQLTSNVHIAQPNGQPQPSVMYTPSGVQVCGAIELRIHYRRPIESGHSTT